jgi:hypothetical protein
MHKDAVDAHGKNFDAELLELRVFLGDRRDFRRSDKGEITGIKTQQNPFPQEV